MQIKTYDPAMGVSYVIFDVNKKGKKQLFSACGRISEIKYYCDKHKIDYSKCKDSAVEGVHYLEKGE